MIDMNSKTLQPRRLLAAFVLVVASISLTGCNHHNEALTRPCPTGAGVKAATLPKLGLTRVELKLQEKCT